MGETDKTNYTIQPKQPILSYLSDDEIAMAGTVTKFRVALYFELNH